jgi:type I restriction enzyme, R subunit
MTRLQKLASSGAMLQRGFWLYVWEIRPVGIDVPEVVNLVLFKPVRSQTKFWQMVGRGTRLCPDLYGPGKDKQNFKIFDACGNLEFFNQPANTPSGGAAPGLNERIFGLIELAGAMEEKQTIPMVREQLPLIQEVQTTLFW